jgi:hypothetical protein
VSCSRHGDAPGRECTCDDTPEDWAETRAREWWHEWGEKYPDYHADNSPAEDLRNEERCAAYNAEAQASLAALLREVANEQLDRQVEMTGEDVQATWTSGNDFGRGSMLAEVRRVVKEVKGDTHTTHDGGHWACSEILARLEKL